MTKTYSTYQVVETSGGIAAAGLAEGGAWIKRAHSDAGKAYVSRKEMDALALIARDQRDLDLGRWRCELYPSMLVYPVDGDTNLVRVLDERTGLSRASSRFTEKNLEDRFDYAAEFWYRQHPLPQPWHNPQHNDVWLLTFDGVQAAYVANCEGPTGKPVFANADHYFGADSDAVTSGELLYTKEASNG